MILERDRKKSSSLRQAENVFPRAPGTKAPSLHWALPKEFLNMLNTAAYLVKLTSFVSMSSPQDHCSHCAFLSAISRHLVQNQLFDTRACWCSPVCVGTSGATFDTWLWWLIPDSRVHPLKHLDILLTLTLVYQTALGSWPRYFWAHLRLMQISEKGPKSWICWTNNEVIFVTDKVFFIDLIVKHFLNDEFKGCFVSSKPKDIHFIWIRYTADIYRKSQCSYRLTTTCFARKLLNNETLVGGLFPFYWLRFTAHLLMIE